MSGLSTESRAWSDSIFRSQEQWMATGSHLRELVQRVSQEISDLEVTASLLRFRYELLVSMGWRSKSRGTDEDLSYLFAEEHQYKLEVSDLEQQWQHEIPSRLASLRLREKAYNSMLYGMATSGSPGAQGTQGRVPRNL